MNNKIDDVAKNAILSELRNIRIDVNILDTKFSNGEISAEEYAEGIVQAEKQISSLEQYVESVLGEEEDSIDADSTDEDNYSVPLEEKVEG